MRVRARSSNSSRARKAVAEVEAGGRTTSRATRDAGIPDGLAVRAVKAAKVARVARAVKAVKADSPDMDLSAEEVRQYWLDFCKRHEVGKDLVARGEAKIKADPDHWADHTMWELLESLADPKARKA